MFLVAGFDLLPHLLPLSVAQIECSLSPSADIANVGQLPMTRESLADGRIAFVVIPVKNGFPSGTTLSRVYDPVSGSVDSDFITIAPASGYRALSSQLTLLTSGNLVVT
jgi:hypothetical protein